MSATDYISVTARRAGFRRAGRAWATEPTVVATALFTAAQLVALHKDPNLIIALAEAPAPTDEAAAAEAPATATPPDLRQAAYLSVTARRAGFRRAGRAWPAEPVIINTAAFDEPQLQGIIADPGLIVVEAAAPAAEDGGEDREARLDAAILSLAADRQEGDFTKDGKPAVGAVERVFGGDLTAAERDAAWARYERDNG